MIRRMVVVGSASILVACSTVDVQNDSAGNHRLSFELTPIYRLEVMENKMIEKAGKLCPNGWEQVAEEVSIYEGGYGTKLRTYRTGNGYTFNATVRCVG